MIICMTYVAFTWNQAEGRWQTGYQYSGDERWEENLRLTAPSKVKIFYLFTACREKIYR